MKISDMKYQIFETFDSLNSILHIFNFNEDTDIGYKISYITSYMPYKISYMPYKSLSKLDILYCMSDILYHILYFRYLFCTMNSKTACHRFSILESLINIEMKVSH